MKKTEETKNTEGIKRKELVKKIENSQTVQKGKKGISSVIFGRTFLVFFSLFLQLIFMVWGYYWLASKWYFVNGVVTVLGVLEVIYVANERSNPAFKLAWTIVILALPIFGSLLYLFVETQPATKWINKRLQSMHAYSKKYWKQDKEVLEELEETNDQVAHLARYVNHFGGFSVYKDTSAKYFPSGEAKFEELLIQLRKAEKFIFMEYFIVAEGYMWESILEILKAKVKEGVEVRFLYDGMCCLSLLPYHYPQELESYGIQCHMFAPIVPALSTRQNNRDHRKIVVIDGKVAFTGGINLADEYINRKERFGHWKDTAIMITGEAVRSFTIMFLEMWSVDKNLRNMPLELFEKYLDIVPDKESEPGDGFIMPYGDSPLDNEAVGEQVYMDILYTAKDYVHIMTPYLILSNEMITALTYAAKRGVDVKIIMPHIPDKWYAFVLANTYYNELLDAGVKIYEYTPGFVHAKVFTSDDEKAVVGTINLDYRSLYLHFECAVYLYQNEEIPSIEEDFQETLAKCQEVLPSDYKRQKFFDRMAGRVLRILAPLM